MAEENSSRIKSLDFFKGAATFAIIFVHVSLLQKDFSETPSTVITEILYAGLMGFFVISGYFYRPERNFLNNLMKRLVRLVLLVVACVVVLSFVLWAFINAFGHQTLDISDYCNVLVTMFTGGQYIFTDISNPQVPVPGICSITAGYYYLPVLFLSTALFYAAADWILKNRENMIVTIAVLLFLAFASRQFLEQRLAYNIQLVPIATVFVIIGGWMGKHSLYKKLEDNLLTKKYLAIVAGALVIGVVFCLLFPTGMKFDRSDYGQYEGWSVFTFFIINLCFVLFLFAVSCVLSKIPYFSDIISFVGKHTLAVLLLHMFFMKLICSLFYVIPGGLLWLPPLDTIQTIALGLCALGLSLLTAVVFQKLFNTIKTKYSLSTSNSES